MHPIFDSHAHYDDEKFAADREELLSSLPAKGVSRVLNIGCDLASSKASLALAAHHADIWCAVGIHPHSAREAREAPDYLAQLAEWAGEEKVVAIGEIGLDYHYDFSPREIQREVFAEQLSLAKELDLPVVVHSREATADTLALLREYRPKGVVHCFSSSRETAREILSLGIYLGYTGVVTFPNARKVIGAVEDTPLDRLLLETDCPYMAPVPLRGKRCDSSMIRYTAERIAQIKGISPDEIIRSAYENTCRLFGIALPALQNR